MMFPTVQFLQNIFTKNYIHIANQGDNISYSNWIVNNTFNTIGPDGSYGIYISNAGDYFIYLNDFNYPSTEWDELRFYYGFDYIGGRFAITVLDNVNNFLICDNYFYGNYDILDVVNSINDLRTSINFGFGIKTRYSTNITVQCNTFLNLAFWCLFPRNQSY